MISRPALRAAVIEPDDPRAPDSPRVIPEDAQRITIGRTQLGYRHDPRARVVKLTTTVGRMRRRKCEIERLGRFRAMHDPETPIDPSAWATVIADTLLFDFDKLTAIDFRRVANAAAIEINDKIANEALDRAALRFARQGSYCQPIRSDRVGKMLGLSCEERLACVITTMRAIDETWAERQQRRIEDRRLRDRNRKRIARAGKTTPRSDYEANSVSRTKPWEAAGMSRATWYRRGKPKPETRASTRQGYPIEARTDPVSLPFMPSHFLREPRSWSAHQSRPTRRGWGGATPPGATAEGDRTSARDYLLRPVTDLPIDEEAKFVAAALIWRVMTTEERRRAFRAIQDQQEVPRQVSHRRGASGRMATMAGPDLMPVGISRSQFENILQGRFGASPSTASKIWEFLFEGAKTVGMARARSG